MVESSLVKYLLAVSAIRRERREVVQVLVIIAITKKGRNLNPYQLSTS